MKKATQKKTGTAPRKTAVRAGKPPAGAGTVAAKGNKKKAAKKTKKSPPPPVAGGPARARGKKTGKSGGGRAPASKRSGDGIRMREVLVPIDFSVESARALEYGVALSRQFKSHLILMFVVDLPFTTGDLGTDIPRLENQIREKSEQELVRIAREVARKGCSVETIVSSGRPFREIIDVANRRKVDLIIVATHGESKVRHVVLGSNAERVARFASCPVLIVREADGEPTEF